MDEKEERGVVSPSEIESNKENKIQESVYNHESNKDEIDLIELFLAFWKERRYVFYSFGVFFIIGIIVAYTSNEEYTSQVRLLPEGRQQTVGMGLAEQFGLRTMPAATTDGISTRFYPEIVRSNPFLLQLLDHKIYYSEINDSLSLSSYFNEFHSDATFVSQVTSFIRKYTIRLPSTIAGWLKKSEPRQINPTDSQEIVEAVQKRESLAVISLSSQERRAIGRLRSRITVDNREGIITVASKMPEPAMTTDLVDHVTNSLIDFIKNYRTEKARADVEFIEERYKEARQRFEQSQKQLARFRDENRGQLTQLARTEEQRLQSEYDLTFNVYNTLARRLEEARLTQQEETPVVKILEPAVVPISPSEPRRDFIITIYTVLGIFTGFGLIFVKLVRRRIREAVNQRFS